MIHLNQALFHLVAMYYLDLCYPSESRATHLEAMYYLALCYPSKSSSILSRDHVLPSFAQFPSKSSAIPSHGHVLFNLALCYPSESRATHLEAMYYLALCYPSKSSSILSRDHVLPSFAQFPSKSCAIPSRGQVHLVLSIHVKCYSIS